MTNAERIAELIERDAWLDLFAAAPDRVRESLGLASTRMAGIGLLGCRAIPITELNRAMAVGAESLPSRADLDAVTAWLDGHAASWALQVAPGAQTSPLRNDLADVALVETGSGWAKFVATAPHDPVDGAVEVKVEMVDGASADAFGRAVTEGFGLPDVCGIWFAALAGRRSWQCFMATIDGEVAGGGTMFARDGAAWFGIEATRPAYRRRGVQRSVIAAQIRAAASAGATVVTCETSQPADPADTGFSSYRNQQRVGLSHAYARSNFKRQG